MIEPMAHKCYIILTQIESNGTQIINLQNESSKGIIKYIFFIYKNSVVEPHFLIWVFFSL